MKIKNLFTVSLVAAAALSLSACGGASDSDLENDMVGMTIKAQVRDGGNTRYDDGSKTIKIVRGTAFGITASANSVGQQTKIIWNGSDYYRPNSNGLSVFIDNINVYKADSSGEVSSELISDTRGQNECIVYGSSSGALTNNTGATRSCTASFRFVTTGTYQIHATAYAGVENNETSVTKTMNVVVVNSAGEL